MFKYKPYKSSTQRLHTVYTQQRRHYQSKGDNRCPIDIFIEDMDDILTKWRTKGNKITLFMDAHVNLANGKVRTLLNKNNLRDLVNSYIKQSRPATFHAASKKIGAPDVDCYHT